MKKPKRWKVKFVVVDAPENNEGYYYFKEAIKDKIIETFQQYGISVEDLKVEKT